MISLHSLTITIVVMLINLTLVLLSSRAFFIPIITENTTALLSFNHFSTVITFVES